MKKTVFIAMLGLAGLISACSNISDDPSPTNVNPNSTKEAEDKISNSDWKVDYFSERGKNETYKFNGYVFRFLPGNVLEAETDSAMYTGTWAITNSGDDDAQPHSHFVITIGGNKAMDELSDDWMQVEVSSNLISLKDDNADNNEELRFLKN